LHTVTTVCGVQTIERFQTDKSTAKYILNVFSINAFNLSLVEGNILKRQDEPFLGGLQTTLLLEK
jgi:hypothetical protein